MKLLLTDVPEGSHAFRGWFDVPAGDTDTGEAIDVVGLLERVDKDTCRVAMTKGRLSRGMLQLLVWRAKELGYSTLYFSRSIDMSLRHFAEKEEQNGNFTTWKVDLGSVD